MDNKKRKLIDLLEASGQAHHQAFIEVDGEDPEWPTWYAEWLIDDISDLLGYSFEIDQLAAELDQLDTIYREEEPEMNWQEFYADYLVSKYVEKSETGK